MVDERYTVLLSPPTSPLMSDATAKTGEYYYSNAPSTLGYTSDVSSQHIHTVPPTQYEQVYGSDHTPRFPISFGPTPWSSHDGRNDPGRPSNVSYDGRLTSQTSQGIGQSGLPQKTAGGSVPASLADRLTPRSPSDTKAQPEDEELMDSGAEDQDDDESGDKSQLTPQELRARKRKMKRFRLTHTQTRYLINEFTRQAHPDAAHRDRLAREIPGLSARQVQVWFQNRRAKLKRLTNDDQERMMRSRAIPISFDSTQALHPPFGAQPSTMAGPIPNIGGYQTYNDATGVRPLTLDTLRRVPDYEHNGPQYTTSSGISPAMGAFGFTPPQSASEHFPPGSTNGMPTFGMQHHQQQGPYDASRRPSLGLPASYQSAYSSQASIPRLPLHDRLSRVAAEPTSSPLRSSSSYSGLTAPQSQQFERSASIADPTSCEQRRPQPSRTLSHPNINETVPYGLGYSYSHSSPFQHGESQQQSSGIGSIQPQTESEQYRRASLPVSTYAQYPNTGFTTSCMPQYQNYNTQYPPQTLPGSYHSQTADQQPQTSPISHGDYNTIPRETQYLR